MSSACSVFLFSPNLLRALTNCIEQFILRDFSFFSAIIDDVARKSRNMLDIRRWLRAYCGHSAVSCARNGFPLVPSWVLSGQKMCWSRRNTEIVFKLQFSEATTSAVTAKEKLSDKENSFSKAFNSTQARFHFDVLSRLQVKLNIQHKKLFNLEN